MEKIIRSLGNVSANEESRRVEGYALLFDTQSRFMGWYETIARGALTQDVIDNSDVFALFNHDENKVLARSENGKGTLTLEIDDKGLKYSFDAPKTALGDELLEYLNRGDIHQSSFAFGIDFDDEEMVSTERRDGNLYLTIKKIPMLMDVSPVWHPAYSETFVGKRALEIYNRMLEEDIEKHNNDDMKRNEEDLENKEQEQENVPVDEQEKEQVEREEVNEEQKEEEVNEENTENDSSEDEEERSEEQEENKEEENKEEEQVERSLKNIKINNHINMKKTEKFSLVNAVRSLINKNEATDTTNAVLKLGEEQLMKRGGIVDNNTIYIPFNVAQRDITVSSVGEDLVVTGFAEMLEPLRAENVMVKAGADFIENLNTNLQIPILTGNNVGWAGEIEEASDSGAGSDSIILTPKRITAYLPISKEFLAVDSLGAEAKLRKDLIAAVASQLEATMLSADAGTAVKPAGLFNGLTAGTVANYKDICDLEADIEGFNINGELKYIVDPKAKSALRNMPRSEDHTRLVMENGEIDGEEVLRTTNMPDNTVAVGDWSNVVIAQFGPLELTYDTTSGARYGVNYLVVNAFFDFACTREGSIAYATISE